MGDRSVLHPPLRFQFCWLTDGLHERLPDMPRAYPAEFRACAIALARAGKKRKQTAVDLEQGRQADRVRRLLARFLLGQMPQQPERFADQSVDEVRAGCPPVPALEDPGGLHHLAYGRCPCRTSAGEVWACALPRHLPQRCLREGSLQPQPLIDFLRHE
ncbi:hypothetical protein DN051_44085 (plasmid) [Streptomyces cadmiisoli]|uniref:Uncharacterized protein n=1 Tax=Streptomyces cadmiisoli TaxID=2184053 RepID=A0A2Z4JEH3_9ACTN|nr:hypothetical protein DN051_44085 [Streptomyces cadmiisoli]